MFPGKWSEASRSATSGEGMPRFDDFNARIPLGMGFVGRVAITAEHLRVTDANADRPAAFGFDWLEREQIRVFGGTPKA